MDLAYRKVWDSYVAGQWKSHSPHGANEINFSVIAYEKIDAQEQYY